MTPLMQQYQDVKSLHPDKIVFFRMGDFYEMFHDDAVRAAPLLGITLTSRNKKAQDHTPMCGVPHHAAGPAISRLTQQGFRVAICDQLEDPKQAKREGRAIVRRGVTRVFSPGMVFDAELLSAKQPHFIAAILNASEADRTVWELAFVEPSTGQAYVLVADSVERLRTALDSVGCAELIVSESTDTWAAWMKRLSMPTRFQSVDKLRFATGQVIDDLDATLRQGIEIELNRLGLKLAEKVESSADLAMAIVLEQMAPESAWVWLKTATPGVRRTLNQTLGFGPSVFQHLEVFQNAKGDEKGSLFHVIDRTVTSGGARLLKSWLQFPLCSRKLILERQSRIEQWVAKPIERTQVQSLIQGMGDLRRRLMKLSGPTAIPFDLRQIQKSMAAALDAVSQARSLDAHVTLGGTEAEHLNLASELEQLSRHLDRLLVDEPPTKAGLIGAIRKGVVEELDRAIDATSNATKAIVEYEIAERERTSIPSLKVRYNNIYGYSIEVTHTHQAKVPLDRYSRKQTLANAERYTTSELISLEAQALASEEARSRIEHELLADLTDRVLKAAKPLNGLAEAIEQLDVVMGLAEVAQRERWTKPELRDESSSRSAEFIRLLGSRHPAVEFSLREQAVGASSKPFVKNDIEIRDGQCVLLTGPNMAGKSTLMRQVAVAVLLAQMGSFVPADRAELPVLRHIATRIGAHDSLSEGLSTFMVEMRETADLLKFTGKGTLLILDEIGRGTATFDGLSLAQSILEHLLSKSKGFTLFATHYHELAQLERERPNLLNAHMGVALDTAQTSTVQGASARPLIRFLYQLRRGPATRSYGVEVARLAGLPREITHRAEVILSELERRMGPSQLSLLDQPELGVVSEPPMDPAVQQLLKTLGELDVNRMTPLAALNTIQHFKELQEQTRGAIDSAST